MEDLAKDVASLCEKYAEDARQLLKDVIAVCEEDYMKDGCSGMSGNEAKRLNLLKSRIVSLRAVEKEEDVFFDDFGSLVWIVTDSSDHGNKKVIFFDGHSDTVDPLPSKWKEKAGVDCFRGLLDRSNVNTEFLTKELEYLPPQENWDRLIFGRGSADQLAGVVTQVFATKVLLELKSKGSLKGKIIRSIATISEEDNDGASAYFMMENLFPKEPKWIPDVVVITEATGDTRKGPLGLYRGQRGRTTIRIEVDGKSCHGSMPHLGKNPLEYGAKIISEMREKSKQDGFFKTDAFLGSGTQTASWCQLMTPSDCAVPQEFVFKYDRRLTIGETAQDACAKFEKLQSVKQAREDGLQVKISIPIYEKPTWAGKRLNNAQNYNAWCTPEDAVSVKKGVEAFELAVAPFWKDGPQKCRVDGWIFSTDGVGYVTQKKDWIPASWIQSGDFWHPQIIGIGPAREQHAHRIGEYCDLLEIQHATSMLSMFCILFA